MLLYLHMKKNNRTIRVNKIQYIIVKVLRTQIITLILKIFPSFMCSPKCFFKLSSDVLKLRFLTNNERDYKKNQNIRYMRQHCSKFNPVVIHDLITVLFKQSIKGTVMHETPVFQITLQSIQITCSSIANQDPLQVILTSIKKLKIRT